MEAGSFGFVNWQFQIEPLDIIPRCLISGERLRFLKALHSVCSHKTGVKRMQVEQSIILRVGS